MRYSPLPLRSGKPAPRQPVRNGPRFRPRFEPLEGGITPSTVDPPDVLTLHNDNSPGSGMSSATDDIDPQLLQNAQAYLESQLCRQTPPLPLVEAWEEFFYIYNPVIRSYAVSCGAPTADLDDCTQEVWTTLVTKLGDFRYDPPRGRFLSWLFTVVHSKATDLHRSKTRHPTESLTSAEEGDLYASDMDPVAEYEQRRRQALVNGALDELRKQVSERNYRVLHMRSVEGRTVAETAAALGLEREQVRLLHYRLKQKLGERLKLYR
jgi:RNA polymerase sigma factor (sigma-70 family)